MLFEKAECRNQGSPEMRIARCMKPWMQKYLFGGTCVDVQMVLGPPRCRLGSPSMISQAFYLDLMQSDSDAGRGNAPAVTCTAVVAGLETPLSTRTCCKSSRDLYPPFLHQTHKLCSQNTLVFTPIRSQGRFFPASSSLSYMRYAWRKKQPRWGCRCRWRAQHWLGGKKPTLSPALRKTELEGTKRG